MTISRTDAVKMFTEMFHDVSVNESVDVEKEVQKFTSFYRDTRITNASLENEGDLLLMEWGETTPHVMSKVTDFTVDRVAFNNMPFHPEERIWLGLTRQIHLSDIEDNEFDGDAIGLCLFFFFELSNESNYSGHGSEWFDGFDGTGEMDRLMTDYFNTPDLRYFRDVKPAITNAFISGIG